MIVQSAGVFGHLPQPAEGVSFAAALLSGLIGNCHLVALVRSINVCAARSGHLGHPAKRIKLRGGPLLIVGWIEEFLRSPAEWIRDFVGSPHRIVLCIDNDPPGLIIFIPR